MTIQNTGSNMRMEPEDWRNILSELPEGSKITKEVGNPEKITLTEEDMEELRSTVAKIIKAGDSTVAQGALGSGPGHWKPQMKEESHMQLTQEIFAKVATGDVPREIRRVLMTGQIMAQDKDGTRVRPIIIPSFVLGVSLSAIGTVLKKGAREKIGVTQMGMGTKYGCAIECGLLKAWTGMEPHKCLISLDAGGVTRK